MHGAAGAGDPGGRRHRRPPGVHPVTPLLRTSLQMNRILQARGAWASLLLAAATGDRAQAQLPAAAAPAAAPAEFHQSFKVFLEDRQIGMHRFDVVAATAESPATVHSAASFTVKILGISAYRYRHRDEERWQDGCLVGLDATSDDNGRTAHILAQRDGVALAVTGGKSNQSLRGCIWSYAYWDQRLTEQRQLLNPQTGAYESVQTRRVGREELSLGGAPVPADHYRLRTAMLDIHLWYSPQGDWLQLESITKDGKRLRYRLH